jgi:hypothetical protein
VTPVNEEAAGTGPLALDMDDEMSPSFTKANEDKEAPREATEESLDTSEAFVEVEEPESPSQNVSDSVIEDDLISTSSFSLREPSPAGTACTSLESSPCGIESQSSPTCASNSDDPERRYTSSPDLVIEDPSNKSEAGGGEGMEGIQEV